MPIDNSAVPDWILNRKRGATPDNKFGVFSIPDEVSQPVRAEDYTVNPIERRQVGALPPGAIGSMARGTAGPPYTAPALAAPKETGSEPTPVAAVAAPSNQLSWDTPVPKGATNINTTGGVGSYSMKGANGDMVHNFVFQPPENKVSTGNINASKAVATYDKARGVFTTTMPTASGANGAVAEGSPAAQGAGALTTGAAANNYMLGGRGANATAFLDTLKQQYADKLSKYNPFGGPGVPGHAELADMAKTISTLEAATQNANVATMGHEVQAANVKSEDAYRKGLISHYEQMNGIEQGKLGVELAKLGLEKQKVDDLLKTPKHLSIVLALASDPITDELGNQTGKTVLNREKLPWAYEAAQALLNNKPLPAAAPGKTPTKADYEKFAKDNGNDKTKIRDAMTKAGFTIPK